MRQQETVRDPIEKTTNLGVRGSNPFGRASDFNGLECFAQPAKFGQLPYSSHGSGAERPCLLESGVRAPLQYRCSKPQKIGSCFARRSQSNTVQISLFLDRKPNSIGWNILPWCEARLVRVQVFNAASRSRQAKELRFRRWHRADQHGDPGVEQGHRRRLALHSAGQAAVGRVYRELQRALTRRMPERDAVLDARRGSRRPCALAPRLQ
jgi:hypothetical protein